MTRQYPAGYITTTNIPDQMSPYSRPWDARLKVSDDSYELAHDFAGMDALPSNPYKDTVTLTIAAGNSIARAFIKCSNLHPLGSALKVVGAPDFVLQTPPIAVLSPCRYPSLVGSLQSGHCSEYCKVLKGSSSFRVELGRRVAFQEVVVENRGSCCGRGD